MNQSHNGKETAMPVWDNESQRKFEFIQDMLKTILDAGNFNLTYEAIKDEKGNISFRNNAKGLVDYCNDLYIHANKSALNK